MEHLQKIPFILSIFGPAAFFLLGLWLAYWIWFKDAKRLRLALYENEKLQKELEGISSVDLSDLQDKFEGAVSSKLEESDKAWSLKLADKDKELSSKGDLLLSKDKELSTLNGKMNGFLSTEKDLKLKLDAESKKFADLDLNFGNFKSEKEKEYKLLLDDKNSLQADLKGKGGDSEALEEKLVQLQSDYDRVQLERKSTSQTITNLIAKVDALEAEKAQADENDNSGELEALNLKVSDLEAQLNAKDSELGDLNSKIDGGDLSIFGAGIGIAGLAAGASGKLGLSDVNAKVGDLEAQLAEKNAKLEAGGNTDSELADLKLKYAELEAELASKDEELGFAKADLEISGDSAVNPAELTPAAFFAGTAATEHERFGYVYGERGDAGHVDDLTEIKGVGEVLQPKLNEYGVYQFKQIALWDQENIDAFQTDLDFPGRVEREQWVNQAADLHRKNHGEHLAPVVDIYKPAKTRMIVKEVGPSLEDFEGDNVKADEKYGVLYNAKPDEVDDLKEISGVAGVLEGKLNEFGVYRYKQIALWSKNNIDEFSEGIGFPDRIERDQWIAQSLDLHYGKYEERLAPRYTVFHDAPAPKTGKSKEQLQDEFKGEDVEVSDKLGVIFNSRPDEVDDLKLIKGVAKVLEAELHKIGIYRFKQIANWEVSHMTEFSERLAFPGRVERDDWKSQSKQFHKEKYGVDA